MQFPWCCIQEKNTMDTGYNSNVFLKAGSTAACLLMVSVDYHNGTAG